MPGIVITPMAGVMLWTFKALFWLFVDRNIAAHLNVDTASTVESGLVIHPACDLARINLQQRRRRIDCS